jgi:uncharacterized protein (TIGR02246 family)
MPTSLQDASRAIDAEWQAAWNDGHDMSRMAALLTPDVDFVNVLGSHWNGSAEVERMHAAMHTAQFHDSVWENHESQAQLPGPDLGWRTCVGRFVATATPMERRGHRAAGAFPGCCCATVSAGAFAPRRTRIFVKLPGA